MKCYNPDTQTWYDQEPRPVKTSTTQNGSSVKVTLPDGTTSTVATAKLHRHRAGG